MISGKKGSHLTVKNRKYKQLNKISVVFKKSVQFPEMLNDSIGEQINENY